MSTNTIDRVVYDPLTSTIYLNESIISTGANPSTKLYSGRTTEDGWQILSAGSHYISWTEGTSVAVVAAMISVALGFGIGGAAVIGAIGSAGISVLAASCTGGTVYMELYICIQLLLYSRNIAISGLLLLILGQNMVHIITMFKGCELS